MGLEPQLLPLTSASTPGLYEAANFIVTPGNQLVFHAVMTSPWAGGPFLCLTGPAGSGKHHLAHVWAKENQALFWQGEANLPSQRSFVCVLPRLLTRVEEEALFHFYNAARAEGCTVLFVSLETPQTMHFVLADLASRLRSIPVTHMPPPDDALLAAITLKEFSALQVSVTPAIVQFLLTHTERSVDSLRHAVALLNERGLAAHHKLTLPFVRRVLAAEGMTRKK